MHNHIRQKLIISVVAAAILTAICGFGWVDHLDYSIADHLYLHEEATDGEIIIVGIDDTALSQLGPTPWSRDIYAKMVNFLMSSPGGGPVAIALDVLFLGESSDPAADAALVEACRKAGNVVVGCSATYGSALIVDGDDFYIDNRVVTTWDEPFPALAKVAHLGNINSMADFDGVLRHVIYSVEIPGVGTFKSMPRVIYEMYAEAQGLELHTPQTSEDGFFYLPYTSKSGAFYEGISVMDLINETVDPGYFDGKIVLIAPYTAGLLDDYRTSIDRSGTMYGIEIQANQIEAYLNGFFPTEAREGWQLAVLFTVSMLMLLLYMRGRVIQSAVAWLVVMILSIWTSYGLYLSGHITHPSWIPLCISVLFIVSVVGEYLRETRERKRVTDMFGKYVDPVVIRQLLQGENQNVDLFGQTYNIAVMFVDIRGFTAMSETLKPEEVVDILNRYLSMATESIMKYHGTLDKFIGDCAMAFWNAPLPQEDPVYLACCAAVDLLKASQKLREEIRERYGRDIALGAGIHYGPAVVGNVGSSMRMDYTAIGDTVNTASRLETKAPPDTIYISRVVADAIEGRAKVTPLETQIPLKGKQLIVEVLKLEELF